MSELATCWISLRMPKVLVVELNAASGTNGRRFGDRGYSTEVSYNDADRAYKVRRMSVWVTGWYEDRGQAELAP